MIQPIYPPTRGTIHRFIGEFMSRREKLKLWKKEMELRKRYQTKEEQLQHEYEERMRQLQLLSAWPTIINNTISQNSYRIGVLIQYIYIYIYMYIILYIIYIYIYDTKPFLKVRDMHSKINASSSLHNHHYKIHYTPPSVPDNDIVLLLYWNILILYIIVQILLQYSLQSCKS